MSIEENGGRAEMVKSFTTQDFIWLTATYVFFLKSLIWRNFQNGDLERKRELHVCAVSTFSNSSSIAIAEIIYRLGPSV